MPERQGETVPPQLAEFPSAVDAVQCAVAVQEKLAEAGTGEPDDRRLQFRIGIHVGDVAVRGGDLLGDGINVAARLEGVAEPGGIAISGAAHGYVRKALPMAYTDLGEQHVKNLDEPVRAYAVRSTPAAAAAPTATQPKPLPLPDKPSIAVLPFTNMSGDPEQEYFADGIVEDIITALSRFRWSFVIARNSSFTYKGRAVNLQQIGRELGVRYVLEGSIRKSGSRVRISSQLIEAESGYHVWGDRFDRDLHDIFSLQDEITDNVLGALPLRLEEAEIARSKRKPTDSLGAYDHYLRGVASASFGHGSREAYSRALECFYAAIALDPDFAAAYSRAALCFAMRKNGNWFVDRTSEVAEAERLARRAVQLGQDDGAALCYSGHVLAYVAGDLASGARATERALVLHPNLAPALHFSAFVSIWEGRPELAVERLTRVMRLSPLDPALSWWQSCMAHAHYHADRCEEAVAWALRALSVTPSYVEAARILAAAYGLADRREEARSAVARLRALDPVLRVSTLRDVLGPYEPDGLARYERGLRRAGLPE